MRREPHSAWLELLASLVPEEAEVGLLRALLWDGAPARAQWSKWVSAVGDPKAYFERDYLGRKGLLAFLAHRISVNGIEVSEDLATYVRVAQVREELRSRIFLEVLGSVLGEMGRVGADPLLINGAAYAFTVYAEPLVRHNHGIDLMVGPEQAEPARRAIEKAGFLPERTSALPRAVLGTFRHGSGLELTLRSKLYLAPHVIVDDAEVRVRGLTIAAGDAQVRVLGPSDRLCHTLGESAAAPTRRNLRWACDAYHLLRQAESLDFDLLVTTADDLGVALPCAVLLEFFRSQLECSVPLESIAALRRRGTPESASRSALLLSTALRTSTSVDEFVKRASRGRLRVKAARFALFPTREHIVYQQRSGTSAGLLTLYLQRFARRFMRPLRRLTRLGMVTS